MITTYDELKSSIADWLIRGDLTAVIPSFIQFAEADMSRKLITRNSEAYGLLTTGNGQATVPTDFAGIRNIEVRGQNGSLTYAPPDFFDGFEERVDTAQYYTIQGNNILLYPAPPDGTVLEIRYRTLVPTLSDTRATNWILDRHPDIYLYGSLIHSAGYLDDDSRMPMWVSLYAAAIKSANDNDMTETLGSTLQMISAEGNPY
tara:strand:+ start:229 stop:837 length:609 start_codon:yes stop_codon:yes gene_type:complete